MIIIFVAGASGCGKSELSKQLLAKLHSLDIKSSIVEMDNYYKAILAGQKVGETNYDVPESIDLTLLQEHIITLERGESIAKPLYDFESGRRTGFEVIHSPEVLIIEGIFALHFAKTYCSDTEKKIYVFIETDSYLALLNRRDIRNQKERKYKDRATTLGKEHQTVGPAFFFGGIASSKHDAHIVVDNSEPKSHGLNPLDVGVNEIIEALEARMPVVDQTRTVNSLAN